MMVTRAAIVWGDSVLDNRQVRLDAIRIPEVGLRVRQAQKILDRLGVRQDLFSYLCIDDSAFCQQGHFRTMVSHTIHIGLHDRLVRRIGRVPILVSPKGTLPLLLTLSGSYSLEEMIQSLLTENLKLYQEVHHFESLSLGKYDVIRQLDLGFECLMNAAMTPSELASFLADEVSVQQIVNVGPETGVLTSQTVDPTHERLEIFDNIETDIMLSWFWNALKGLPAKVNV